MDKLKAFYRRQSLQSQLIFWFLLISLVPLSWTSFMSYELAKKIILNQSTDHLHALSLRQAHLIENYIREKERNAASLAKGTVVAQAAEAFIHGLQFGIDSPQYHIAEETYRSILAFRTDMLGYHNLFLVTPDGKIVFSVHPSSSLKVNTNILNKAFAIPELTEIFHDAKAFLEIQISPLLYSQPSPSAFIAAPLLENNKLFGIALVQIDNAAIYQLVANYSGLGETGETILVDRDKSTLVSITPLRHQTEPTIIHEINPTSSFGEFVQQVLNGHRLVDRVMDYRGQETLMVGRNFLPALTWGIITKMDTAELLAPINKLKYFSWILTLTTAAIVLIIASNLSREITHPLSLLTQKTRQMATGNLAQKIDIQANTEISRLGQSFNDMASQLNNMVQHLDILVSQRTAEVKLQNVQLEETIEELKRTQNRLIHQEKLASLGALTAGIAHEIKNPLNFINNFAELALEIQNTLSDYLKKIAPLINQEEKENLEELLLTLRLDTTKIFEHGKRADSIVRGMLQHSRGTPGEKNLTNLNILLDEYVSLSYHGMRAQDSTFNVRLEKSYDPHLPSIWLIPQEMSRVFLNLLNNAYYAVHEKQQLPSTPSSYMPTVRITTEAHPGFVLIKIWDNGVGIPPSVFPKLFTPFFTTKPTGEGTGLGLSLSYNIVVQGHNGTLTAESKEGQFAEFIIRLPIDIKKG